MTHSPDLQLLKEPLEADFSRLGWEQDDYYANFLCESRPEFLDEDEEIEFLKNLLGEGSYLDLGCGEARLSEALSESHFGVGVDLSFLPLQGASFQKVQADYFNLPFSSPFDTIFLGFGQICFLQKEELTGLLRALKRLLNRGGKIYMDLPTIDLVQGFHSRNEWFEAENGLVFLKREYDPAESQFHQARYEWNRNTGMNKTHSVSYQMYSLYELIDLFHQLRLQVVYGFEDFAEKSIQEESPWMIFVLQKK